MADFMIRFLICNVFISGIIGILYLHFLFVSMYYAYILQV